MYPLRIYLFHLLHNLTGNIEVHSWVVHMNKNPTTPKKSHYVKTSNWKHNIAASVQLYNFTLQNPKYQDDI